MKINKTTSKTQKELESEFKWSYLYKSPEKIIKIIESNNLTNFSKYADISRENETGATNFFFLSENEVETLSISTKFLTPAIKSIKNIDAEYIQSGNKDKYILDTNDFIQNHNINDSEEVKKKLDELNHNNLLKYIEQGENEGYDKRGKCKSRNIWFNIDVKTPPLLHPKFYRERVFTIINEDYLAPSTSLQSVFPKKSIKSSLIASITNSYIYKILIEFWGRNESGLLQCMIYELKSIPFPDLDELTEPQKDKLEQSYTNILNDEYQGLADEVILELINMDDELTVEELQLIQQELVEDRVN